MYHFLWRIVLETATGEAQAARGRCASPCIETRIRSDHWKKLMQREDDFVSPEIKNAIEKRPHEIFRHPEEGFVLLPIKI